MKNNKTLKWIAILGIGYLALSMGFEAGKGYLLGTMKAYVKLTSADETVNLLNEIPNKGSSKIFKFVSEAQEKYFVNKLHTKKKK